MQTPLSRRSLGRWLADNIVEMIAVVVALPALIFLFNASHPDPRYQRLPPYSTSLGTAWGVVLLNCGNGVAKNVDLRVSSSGQIIQSYMSKGFVTDPEIRGGGVGSSDLQVHISKLVHDRPLGSTLPTLYFVTSTEPTAVIEGDYDGGTMRALDSGIDCGETPIRRCLKNLFTFLGIFFTINLLLNRVLPKSRRDAWEKRIDSRLTKLK